MEDKKEFNRIYRELKGYADTESKKKSIEESRKYLLNNWDGIVIYNQDGSDIRGCSAEGHVSHIYSSRMSSRPLRWSRNGADKIGKYVEALTRTLPYQQVKKLAALKYLPTIS